jgi:putative chitinase
MFSFDHRRFFTDFSLRTGLTLTPERRNAIDFLLTKFESDAGFTMLRELAYVLATIRWETAHTFMPIKEKRFNRNTNPREWEKQDRYWRTGFYGRGYVQITWEENYRKAGRNLAGTRLVIERTPVVVNAETFVQNPNYVLNQEAAYAICSGGMRQGWFTGKKLGDFILEGKPPDYVGARRVINGTDHAQDIATLATQFELLLRASV